MSQTLEIWSSLLIGLSHSQCYRNKKGLIRWQHSQRTPCLSAVKFCTGCVRATKTELTFPAVSLNGLPVPRWASHAAAQ